jgi:glutathione synthase
VPTGNDPGPTSPRADAQFLSRSVTWNERGIIEAMSNKLVADGMYFVGIDVVGDKVEEINAESPGGMQRVERL